MRGRADIPTAFLHLSCALICVGASTVVDDLLEQGVLCGKP
jgi:hypothetical protein